MSMQLHFEQDKNKKAFVYTLGVLAVVFALLFLISWKIVPPAPPPAYEDLIEINLGNNEEGFGEEQPLIKGEPGPAQTELEEAAAPPQPAPDEAVAPVTDDNAEEEAAPVEKVVTPVVKPKAVVPNPTPKKEPAKKPAPTTNNNVVKAPTPQRPKLTYNGPGKGTGNNASEDNGFTGQGNRPGARGDAGDPSGNKDSYGNTPGGRVSGPRVIKGTRKVIRYYSFTGDLPRATIYAIVKVSPSGKGTFVGFDKGSTSRSQNYANAITNYLNRIEFDKADTESNVTVQFNFTVN